MNQLNRFQSMQIIEEMRVALQAVATKHGMTLLPCNGVYDGQMVRLKSAELRLVVKDETTGETKVMVDPMCEMMMKRHKLTSDYRMISPLGAEYRITGYNSRAPKYPWNIESRDGDRRRAPLQFIINSFYDGGLMEAA